MSARLIRSRSSQSTSRLIRALSRAMHRCALTYPAVCPADRSTFPCSVVLRSFPSLLVVTSLLHLRLSLAFSAFGSHPNPGDNIERQLSLRTVLQMTNAWHDVSPGNELPRDFTAVIEIPLGRN